MHTFNNGNGVQMVNTGIELTMVLASEEEEEGLRMTHTNFVHHGDPCIFGLLVKLEHGRGNVTCSYDMLLVSYRGFDDCCMKGVWNQTDDQLVLGHRSVECIVVGNIKGDCLCEFHAL